jgi:hypothetical protein
VVRVGTVPQKPPGCAAALCSLHATLNTKCPEYVRNVNEVNVCVLARRCRCDVAVLLLTSVEMPLASSRKSLLWQAVEIQACGTKVICKYCQRASFAASAARIREHLSGGSKDITGCIHVHAVPDDLKAELAKKQAHYEIISAPLASITEAGLPATGTTPKNVPKTPPKTKTPKKPKTRRV